MKIDPRVEDRLRDALAAVVEKNPAGILPPLERLSEEQSQLAVEYATHIVGYVMRDVHDARVDNDIADVMAEDVLGDVSPWLDLGTTDSVAAFLLACATGDDQFTGVDRGDIAMYSLIIAGDLLSHYRPDGMRWFEYLDQIWNDAEAAARTEPS